MNNFNNSNLYLLVVGLVMLFGCAQEDSETEVTTQDSSSNAVAITTEPFSEENVSSPTGRWDVRWESITLTHRKPTPMYAELVIDGSDGNYSAIFNDEKIPLTVDGNTIVFSYNETLRGEVGNRMGQVTLEFTGTIEGNSMHGTIDRTDGIFSRRRIDVAPEVVKHTEGAAPGFHPLTLAQGEMLPIKLIGVSDNWTSTKETHRANPVSLDGVWIPRPEMVNDWLEDFNILLTDEARERKDQWKPYEDPALRCSSAGAVRISGWPLPIDIVQSNRIVAILHEGESVYRRIHTDGRKMPEDWIESGMGYSVGKWEDNVLNVETRWLASNIIGGFGLEHRGDETVMSEKYRITADGKFLWVETTLVDPLTWTEPLRRVTVWEKDLKMEFVPYECDGYTFFRGLHSDGTDDAYFNTPLKY
jgi:hypothetical protein